MKLTYEELESKLNDLIVDLSNPDRSLNRRVDIENHLLGCYQGKVRLPTAEDCRVLALRLGTPRRYWNDYLVNYQFTDDKELH